jgi:hypothetical protein
MNNNVLSPIILFVYNRPIHTLKVLNALSKNPEAEFSELFVYCDGPKNNILDFELLLINQTREIIKNEIRFKNISVKYHETNKGLANSIVDGVTELLLEHDRVIVLEDDIVPEKGFLNYMNSSLKMYENSPEVGCIHAWNYTFKINKIRESSFLLLGGDCWGWATWRQAWGLFEKDGNKLREEILNRNLVSSFNRNNTHDFFTMLEDQIRGKNNSWAIRWHASLFLNNKYCVHPTMPIVRNIGLDGSGTHCTTEEMVQITTKKIKIK